MLINYQVSNLLNPNIVGGMASSQFDDRLSFKKHGSFVLPYVQSSLTGLPRIIDSVLGKKNTSRSLGTQFKCSMPIEKVKLTWKSSLKCHSRDCVALVKGKSGLPVDVCIMISGRKGKPV